MGLEGDNASELTDIAGVVRCNIKWVRMWATSCGRYLFDFVFMLQWRVLIAVVPEEALCGMSFSVSLFWITRDYLIY